MKKLFLSFLISLSSIPALAVEFENGEFKANIYGEIYADAFYSYGGDGYDLGLGGLTFGNHQNAFGSQAFAGSSLLGVELTYKDVTGTFEAGLSDPVRRFLLTYRIKGDEDHYLVFGRDTTIAAYSFGQVSNDIQALNDYGTLADNRRLQVRYGIKGFELAVIIPSLGGGWNSGNTDDIGYTMEVSDNDGNPMDDVSNGVFMVLPRVEAAYTYTNDNFEFKVFGAYGAYMYDAQEYYTDDDNNAVFTGVSNGKRTVAHSFNIGIGGQADFGNSFLQFTGWYGMNLNLMTALENYSNILTMTKNVNGLYELTMNEVHSAGAAIGFGHTIADRYTPQAGIGWTANFGPGYSQADDSLGAYINCVININDWFSITPEIAYLNNLKDGNGDSEGYSIVAGVQALLTF